MIQSKPKYLDYLHIKFVLDSLKEVQSFLLKVQAFTFSFPPFLESAYFIVLIYHNYYLLSIYIYNKSIYFLCKYDRMEMGV